MKNINGFGELRDVYNSVFMRPVYSDFPGTRTDRLHRPPIIWVLALLYIAKLVPSFSSGFFWEILEAAPSVAPKHYFLHLHIIKVLL